MEFSEIVEMMDNLNEADVLEMYQRFIHLENLVSNLLYEQKTPLKLGMLVLFSLITKVSFYSKMSIEDFKILQETFLEMYEERLKNEGE